MIKNCKCCGIDKKLDEFKKGRNQCIECIKAKDRERYNSNKEKFKEYSKNYYINNMDKCKDTAKKYYNDPIKGEKLKSQNREYNKVNSEKIKLKRSIYLSNNKEKINEKSKIYFSKRRSEDLLFKLSSNIRNSINNSFYKSGYSKSSKTQEILGCSFEEFKLYLESKFEPWMTWENRGLYNGEFNYGWDIDHIIPLSSSTTEEDLIKLNHYSNLQPLCSLLNRYYKSNKLI
jgi:hypothetical protein